MKGVCSLFTSNKIHFNDYTYGKGFFNNFDVLEGFLCHLCYVIFGIVKYYRHHLKLVRNLCLQKSAFYSLIFNLLNIQLANCWNCKKKKSLTAQSVTDFVPGKEITDKSG